MKLPKSYKIIGRLYLEVWWGWWGEGLLFNKDLKDVWRLEGLIWRAHAYGYGWVHLDVVHMDMAFHLLIIWIWLGAILHVALLLCSITHDVQDRALTTELTLSQQGWCK